MKRTPIALSILCATMAFQSAHAKDEGYDLNQIKDKLSLTGFIAPTAIYTTDNNFYGSTDDKVSGNYMEVGLLARYEFTPYLSFVGQGLYKNVGASEDYPDVDFAFLDYNAYQSFNHSIDLRAGKIKVPYGLHNDTRDIPFTRNRIFLPQSIYFENFRDSVFSQTGVEIRGEHISSGGIINWNAGLTESESPDNEIESLYSGANDLAEYDGDYSGFFRLMHTTSNNDLRTALSLVRIQYDVDAKELAPVPNPLVGMPNQPTTIPNPAQLQSGTTVYDRAGLSVEYAATDNLTLTAEGEYNQWDFSELDTPLLENDYGVGYYAQARYKWTDDWDTFISAGASYNDFDDKSGKDYTQNLKTFLPQSDYQEHQRYTETASVGVGYQPVSNFMLRGEYSYFEGTSILPGRYNNDSERDKYWQMISVQASYQFDLL